MPTAQIIKKRKKPSLPKGSGTDAPAKPVSDVGKEIGKDSSPPSLPKGGPTPTAATPPDMGKNLPQSIPTNTAAAASDITKEIPTSIPKPRPTPTPAPTVTATVTSTTTIFSSISTTTIHHTETKTITGTNTSAISASSNAASGPIHTGDSLTGTALTDAILAQCPKTTNTLTRTVSVIPAQVTSMVTQTAISSASPTTITVTSTVTPQADRAPTCSALPKHAGPAEIMAVVFGLITLALLVGMFFLARKCYRMHRAERVWRKQVRNEESELTEMGAGSGSGGAGVVVDSMAVHPVRAKLGQRLMDGLAKSFKRKEAWER